MAVFNKQVLLMELIDRTELFKASTQPFRHLDDDQLNYKPAPGSWSIAEIFEHLNISNGMYIQLLLPRITTAPDTPADTFRSGWLGDLIYEMIVPRPDGSVFKMKAPKSMHAATNRLDGHEVLLRVNQKCDEIEDILRHVTTKDLQRIKIPFSVTKLVSLRLGDNLRYLIAHSERHLLQAQRVMAGLPATL
jgi:uncharacterized damage-inducible protein DinB